MNFESKADPELRRVQVHKFSHALSIIARVGVDSFSGTSYKRLLEFYNIYMRSGRFALKKWKEQDKE